MKFLSFFLSRRLYGNQGISRPAVLIATAGIAVGLLVMMIAVAVIGGFKTEIRQKVSGFGAHLQIINREAARSWEVRPIAATDSLMGVLSSLPGVEHVQRIATKPGMIKTADTFQGVVLKGVGREYDLTFIQKHMVEGAWPDFEGEGGSNQAVISASLCDKLSLHVGDKVEIYFIQDDIRVRRLLITGIYETNFSEFDNLFMLTDLSTVARLNAYEADQVSGLELMIDDYDRLEDMTYMVGEQLFGRQDAYGATYCVRNVEQLNPALFAWLDLLDVNIYVILILMTGVAGFTIISGLLIIIIERTTTIGVLKALGATDGMVRRTFLCLAMFLVGRGILWGDVIGLAFYFVQRYTGMLKLDAHNYYMDTVPVALGPASFIILNVGTVAIALLILIGPSHLIARIRPAETMRFNSE